MIFSFLREFEGHLTPQKKKTERKEVYTLLNVNTICCYLATLLLQFMSFKVKPISPIREENSGKNRISFLKEEKSEKIGENDQTFKLKTRRKKQVIFPAQKASFC